jgi:hypothetical protein
MAPKAAPMTTPIARSTAFPRRANFLNSSSMRLSRAEHHNVRAGRATDRRLRDAVSRRRPRRRPDLGTIGQLDGLKTKPAWTIASRTAAFVLSAKGTIGSRTVSAHFRARRARISPAPGWSRWAGRYAAAAICPAAGARSVVALQAGVLELGAQARRGGRARCSHARRGPRTRARWRPRPSWLKSSHRGALLQTRTTLAVASFTPAMFSSRTGASSCRPTCRSPSAPGYCR